MPDRVGPACEPKAFLDTTVPCDRLLSGPATRACVNERLDSFSLRATCKFVQLEFLLGPYRHLARLQEKAEQGEPIEELHRKAGDYASLLPPNRNRRVGSVWLNAFDRYFEQPQSMPGMFRAFMRAFVRNAWREAFARVDEVLDATGCLGYVTEPAWNKNTNTVDSPVSTHDLNRRAEDVAAFIRRERAQFTRIADALDTAQDLEAGSETERCVRAIRKILGCEGEATGGNVRNVGDALIAVECPADHVLLTSNTRHFDPITAAIGEVCEQLPELSKQ